jgi:hypothetical protein
VNRFRNFTATSRVRTALEAFLFNPSVVSRPARLAAPALRARLFALLPALLLFAGCLLGFAPAANAQTTGSVDGIVRDNTGALIPGAKVKLVNEQSKAVRDTTSNGEGYFTINAIQANTYDLIVSMPGFDAYRINGIEIHPGDHTNIAKIAMKIGEVTQEITVDANTAGVALDSGEKSALITADDIARLSTVGRDATELIKILPGFAVSTGGSLNNLSSANASQTMGFGSGSTSQFSAVGSTPQTGMTTVVSDGASAMDPGDMGASISNVNMDMVQEVKVTTSNFGADGASGPVVINAIGKSGGSNYHGSAYLFARNQVLNANDWYSNFAGVGRPPTKYFYPGGNVGGPIKIPGTNFNHNKKLTFFLGFEDYNQTIAEGAAPGGSGLLQSFIPTAAMLGGDLTPATIASALNVSVPVLTTACPNFYTSNGVGTGANAGVTLINGQPGTLGNSQGVCYSPGFASTTYTAQDCLIVAGIIQTSPNNGPGCIPGAFPAVDPHSAIWSKYFPKANRTPQAVPSQNLLSDGYNYQTTETVTNNGYQAHARIDENFTDSLKLYVTYNYETINAQEGVDNVFYAGSDIVPYPTPEFSHSKSNGLSINLTKVFGPTLTNELIAAGNYYYSPEQLANRASVQDAATGWSGGRYYNNGALQLPGIRDYEEGVPGFAMGYFPANSAFLRKFSYDVADNLTKQLKTHSIKVGVYAEVTANNQVPYNFTQGLYTFNHYNAGCITSDGAQTSQLQNNVADFVQGCGGFSQSSSSQNADLHFHSVDFYATDEWKATKRLTLTYGLRFEHLGAWFDPNGLGMAVWTPPAQHVVFNNVTEDPKTYPGISWHQTDKSDPISGQPSRLFFYSPRAGVSYDLYGNGKTTLRGGFGAYRFHDSYNDSAGPLSTTLGIETYANPTNISCTISQIQTQGIDDPKGIKPAAGAGCPVAAGTSSLAPFAIYALDKYDDEQPLVYNYSFNVDQVMPWNSNLEISYVGNQSHDTFTEGNLSNQNYIPLGGLFQPDPITGVVSQPTSTQQNQQDYYPYPNYQQVYVPHHIGYGNYNSLQVSFNRQKGAFIYGVNYTWAKALGIRGDYRTGAVGDPSTLRNNYGYLGFNRNNAVNATYSWQVGHAYHGNRFVGAVLNQWEFSGITSLQSGPDIAVLTGGGNFGLGGGVQYTPPGSTTAVAVPISNTGYLGTPSINLQPVVTCDPRKNLHNLPQYGTQFFNGNCFALPKLGTNGDFELPDVHGPAYFDTDLTVKRSFRISDKQNFVFSLAGFNFLNHPLRAFTGGNNIGLNLGYGLPTGFTATSAAQALASAVQTTPNFGYTPYKQGYRIVELGARYNF